MHPPPSPPAAPLPPPGPCAAGAVEHCQTCDSAGQCTQCAKEGDTQYYLTGDKKCVTKCPTGWWPDNSNTCQRM